MFGKHHYTFRMSKQITTRYNYNGNYIKSEKHREIEWFQTASDCFVSWGKYQ